GKEENFSTHQEEANSTSNEKKPSLSSSEMTRNERTVSKRRLIRQKYAQLSLIFLGALGLIHAFYFARAILIPIALAVVLFFLLAPVVRFMSRWRYVTESVAAGIVVLFMSSLIFTGSYFLATPVTSWIRSAPETFRAAEEKLSFLSEPVGMLDEASEEVSNITNGNEKEDVVKVAIQQPPIISYLLSSTVNVMAGTIITIVLVYLMLAMGHRSINSVVELMPSINDKKGVVNLLRNIELGISRYLVTITLINICLGVVIGFTLGLLGLPDPYLLGIMAALLNFIPYVGPAVGALIVFMISVVNMNTPAEIAAGPLIYLTINTIEGNLITPVIMGHSMKLNPAIVFLHIIFWGWVWGIGGVLLSVPILGILKITFNHFEETKPIAHLLSG
ncbi:MAG: AI-2E family transporter, partial [Planctomycetaceae bacterium]|nr:AI-2E family transporter [Planctomycetaceae bacterium]